MKKSTVGMIATILVVVLSGLSGLFILFGGGISTLIDYMAYIPYMPSGMLTIASSLAAPSFALANGCCICIPIPLAFGVFSLIQRANASALEGPFSYSKPSADL